MSLQNIHLLLCIILVGFVHRCRAPPVEETGLYQVTIPPALSILKTIILGYVAHILIVRPETGIGPYSTMARRLGCFAFPVMGIGFAAQSIYFAFNGDRILGISKFKNMLVNYDQEFRNKNIQGGDNISVDPGSSLFSDTFKSNNQKEFGTIHLSNPEDIFFSKSRHLRDWLIESMRANGIYTKEYDNAPYLAAILHTMGPENAKKVKHCILNENILMGFDSETYTPLREHYVGLTKDLSVSGPGSKAEYQTTIRPSYTRYLSINMLDQLIRSNNVDDTSYLELCITFGQIFFTVVECLEIDGNKWAKVIMIIYTAMSVFQVLSLFILHKQSMPFSIYYGQDISWEKLIADRGIYYLKDLKRILFPKKYAAKPHQSDDNANCAMLYQGSCIRFILERKEFELDRRRILIDIYGNRVHGIFSILGMGFSPLVCIWADYTSQTMTKWLVIGWMIAPVVFHCGIAVQNGTIGYNYLIRTTWLIFISLLSLGCVLTATVFGYIPNYDSNFL
ncbi:hypothetical protein CLU79DRAFT_739538 [Phycomyces nitens]|nr:hypothetical protein CLU79DRAFT_739538 [Phycomyces nitens]